MGATQLKGAVLAAATLLADSSPSVAADAPPQRSSTLVVYGNDRCPEPVGDEAVVCARRPEGERYRVPKALREKERLPGGLSWTSQVDAMNEATRFTRPDSCSVVGSGGQTGCYAQSLRQWRIDRQAARAEAASIP